MTELEAKCSRSNTFWALLSLPHPASSEVSCSAWHIYPAKVTILIPLWPYLWPGEHGCLLIHPSHLFKRNYKAYILCITVFSKHFICGEATLLNIIVVFFHCRVVYKCSMFQPFSYWWKFQLFQFGTINKLYLGHGTWPWYNLPLSETFYQLHTRQLDRRVLAVHNLAISLDSATYMLAILV